MLRLTLHAPSPHKTAKTPNMSFLTLRCTKSAWETHIVAPRGESAHSAMRSSASVSAQTFFCLPCSNLSPACCCLIFSFLYHNPAASPLASHGAVSHVAFRQHKHTKNKAPVWGNRREEGGEISRGPGRGGASDQAETLPGSTSLRPPPPPPHHLVAAVPRCGHRGRYNTDSLPGTRLQTEGETRGGRSRAHTGAAIFGCVWLLNALLVLVLHLEQQLWKYINMCMHFIYKSSWHAIFGCVFVLVYLCGQQ